MIYRGQRIVKLSSAVFPPKRLFRYLTSASISFILVPEVKEMARVKTEFAPCPQCKNPKGQYDSWIASDGSGIIECIYCEECNADFGRYKGEVNYRLIKQFDDIED